jgi:hypothetical protein
VNRSIIVSSRSSGPGDIGHGHVELGVNMIGHAPDDGFDQAILRSVLAAGERAAEAGPIAHALQRGGRVAILGDDRRCRGQQAVFRSSLRSRCVRRAGRSTS